MANPPTAGNAKKIGRGGRKRRVAGWTLLLLGLLVAGVWVASGWWRFECFYSNGHFRLANGMVTVRRVTSTRVLGGETSWEFGRVEVEGWFWWFGFVADGPESSHWGLYRYSGTPMNLLVHSSFHRLLFWPIPLLLWTPAALLLRSGILARRRANTGQCAKCGYSLAGLAPDAPCPECGKAKGS